MICVEVHSNNVLALRSNTFSNAVSNSIKYETIKFLFPDNWNNYQKTAVFSAEGVEPINVLLCEDNELCISQDECYIPFEVLKGDCFEVSVFGVRDKSLATTTKEQIEVLESGYALGDKPGEPTQSEYSQILQMVIDTKQIAQSVREDADNGVFKGDKGDKGDPYTLTEQDKADIVAGVADRVDGIEGDVANIEQRLEPLETDVETIKQGYVSVEYVNNEVNTLNDAIRNIDGDITNMREVFVTKDYVDSTFTTGETVDRRIAEYVDPKTENIPDIEKSVSNAWSNIIEIEEDIAIIKEDYATKQYVDNAVASGGGTEGGGVSSWNDLTDKPFYEEKKTATYDYSNPPSATINFNGIILGKVTDDILTDNHFNGAKASLAFTPDGNTVSNLSQVLNSDMLTKFTLDCGMLYQFVDGYLTCMVASATKTGKFEFNGVMFTIPRTGTYIGFVFTNGYAQRSMSIEYSWIQPLKAKYFEIVNYQNGKQILEEQELAFNFGNGLYMHQLDAISLVVGQKYKVLWDGIEYIYEAIEKSGVIVIGDDFAGYPFVVVVQDNQTMIATIDTAATHTVAINEVGICEIKQEYLPVSLYTEIDQRIENYISEALGGEY